MVTALHILLVEDEPAHAEAIQRAFQAADPRTTIQVASTLREYRQLVTVSPPHIAILDLNLPDGRAVDVLTSPPEAAPFPIIVMTSYGTEQIVVEAMKAGALDYIVKSPEAFAGMPHTIERALREWRLVQEHRRLQQERETELHLLNACNSANGLLDIVRNVTLLMREWSGCEAVGIRLRDGDDFPYFETRGFAPEFVEAENWLCERDHQNQLVRDSMGNPVLECMCGNILRGRFDPTKPFFSARGSFWSNCTTELLASTTEADRQARTRNRCNGEGYESVALVPIRSAGVTFGLLQFNDKRPGRFTIKLIEFLERLADSLANAIAHRLSENALERSRTELRTIYEHAPAMMCVLNTDRRVLYANRAFAEFVGKTEHELAGGIACGALGCINALDDPRRCGFGQECEACSLRLAMEDTFKTGASHRGVERQTILVRENERHVVVLLASTASLQIAGQTDLLLCLEDITERKRAEEAIRKSQEAFSKAFLESPAPISITRLSDARLIEVNEAFEKLFGYRREEFIGHTSVELGLWVDLEDREQALHVLHTEGTTRDLEFRFRAKGGEVLVCHYSAQIIEVDGEPCGLVTLMDVTARKRAETALRESEEKFRLISQLSPAGLYLTTPQGDCTYVNPRWCEMAGLTSEEALGLGWINGIHPDDRQMVSDNWRQMVDSRGHWGQEYRFQDEKGKTVWVHGVATPLMNPDGTIAGYLGVNNDITDRKRTEKQNESLGRLAIRLATFSNIEQIVGAVENEMYQLFEWDSYYFAVRKSEADTFRVLHYVDTIGGEKRVFPAQSAPPPRLYELLRPLLDGDPVLINRAPGEPEPTFHRFGDGERPSRSLMYAPVRSGKSVIGILAAQSYTYMRYQEADLHLLQRVADVVAPALQRAYAEEALKESEQFNREIVHQAGEGVIVYDRELRYVFWNPFMEQLTGIRAADVLGRPAPELFPHVREQGIDRLIGRALKGEIVVSSEIPFTSPLTGAAGWVIGTYAPHRDADGRIIGVIATVHDVTNRKQAREQQSALEEQLRQIQKLDAMGRMAATISHDFKNLLMAMGGHAELALARVGPDADARPHIQSIQRAITEASAVTGSLLTFSRKQSTEKETFCLCDSIQETLPLLRQAVPKRVQIRAEANCDAPCHVMANKGLLHQVLLNLALNASDAMPEGGHLLLNAAPATESEVRECFESADPAQRFVRLTVTDSGEGIRPEIQARIFDPFFTTKERGQGTGLGLSIVHGIIEELDGRIRMRSQVGKGTTFTILLPMHQVADTAPQHQSSPQVHRGNGETLLVAGGEAYLRGTIAWSLETLNYRVTIAGSMQEVLETSSRQEGEIQAVVLDERLADGDGFECERAIRRTNANMPVIILTRQQRDDDTFSDKTTLLGEPFSLNTLAGILRHEIAPASEETTGHG